MTMAEKRLRRRIFMTETALFKEQRKNNAKMARIGWGYIFHKRYVGPRRTREKKLERKLHGYQQALAALWKEGEVV